MTGARKYNDKVKYELATESSNIRATSPKADRVVIFPELSHQERRVIVVLISFALIPSITFLVFAIVIAIRRMP
jgi:hypothetical protein